VDDGACTKYPFRPFNSSGNCALRHSDSPARGFITRRTRASRYTDSLETRAKPETAGRVSRIRFSDRQYFLRPKVARGGWYRTSNRCFALFATFPRAKMHPFPVGLPRLAARCYRSRSRVRPNSRTDPPLPGRDQQSASRSRVIHANGARRPRGEGAVDNFGTTYHSVGSSVVSAVRVR